MPHQIKPENWSSLSLAEQLGNIGSEVERVISWQKKQRLDYAEKAMERALELLDLSLANKNFKLPARQELARVREALCCWFYGQNDYGMTDNFLHKYFLYFGILARTSH